MVSGPLSPVLLVGEVAPRLQGELALQGLPCAVALDQNDAVARLRTASFPFVVVPTIFGDGYSGATFTQGLLQYFDAQVVVYGSGLEQHDLSALLRTGRVAHFPADAEGRIVADFLARRTRSSSSPPSVATPAPYDLTPGALAPGGGFPQVPTTNPTLSPAFFASAAAIPRPPTMGPTPGAMSAKVPDASAQLKLESVVDELVRTQAELQNLRNRAAEIDQERAALLVEVESARRSSMAQVAEVMALSDEGDPISDELEALRAKAANLETEHGAARAEIEMLRAERERLAADAVAQAGALAEARARADAVDQQLTEARARADSVETEAQRLREELERATAEATALREELAPKQALAAQLEHAQGDLARVQGELSSLEQRLSSEVSAHAAALEQQRAGLDRAHGVELEQATQATRAATDEGAALRVESDKLKGDLATARTDVTTLRLDLQEATMRLDEATQQVAAIGAERDALRSEAAPLRDWANQLVLEHARQQEELERMRTSWTKLEDRSRMLDGLQDQVQALTTERDQLKTQGGAAPADVEVVMARARQLADLVGALEPFMWGLTQASQFFTKNPIEGGEPHLKLLQQLQGVLLRLRDEIAMLDLG